MRIRRVSVIVPPSPYMPIDGWEGVGKAPLEGSTLAATVLSRAGYDVTGYDLRGMQNAEDRILGEVAKDDLICLAGTADGYAFVKRFAAAIKKRNPSKPVLLGGCLSSVSWKTVLARTEVDLCLLGECETALPAFVRLLEAEAPPNGLPIAFKAGGRIHGPAVGFITPGSADIPTPDMGVWAHAGEVRFPEVACYSTQRGCRESCSFCANPWKGMWRPLPALKIRDDLRELKARGTREVWFNDPTFNTEESHCWQVVQIMRELELTWTCSIRAVPASTEMFRAMRDAGCRSLFLGIESADDAVLAVNHKAIRLADTVRCLAAATDAGIPIVGFLLLGLPGETTESLARTIEFTRTHSFTPRPRFAMPYPGTSLFHAFAGENRYRLGSPEDIEERILESMSSVSCEGPEPPYEMPGSRVSLGDLRQAMAEILKCDSVHCRHGE